LKTQKGHVFGCGFAILEESIVNIFGVSFLKLLFIRTLKEDYIWQNPSAKEK